MRKEQIFFVFALFLLVSFIGIVSSFDTDDVEYRGSVSVEKGWNLLTFYSMDFSNFLGDNRLYESLRDDGVIAVYLYDEYSRDYIKLYPNLEKEKHERYLESIGDVEEDIGSLGEYSRISNAAMWIYMKWSRQFQYKTLDGPMPINFIELKGGWNLLSVHPSMVGKNIDDIKGECSISKFGYWDAEEQKWEDRRDDEFTSDMIGTGFAIKVREDCKMEDSESSIEPPSLP